MKPREVRKKWLDEEADPVFLNARREAVVVLIGWVVFACWVTGYCRFRAYAPPDAPVETMWGVPAWVLWGVAMPWVAANIFTVWFAFSFMKEDELSAVGEDEIRAVREGGKSDLGKTIEGGEGER